MSQPVKLSDSLVLDARVTAEVAQRSIAGEAPEQFGKLQPELAAKLRNHLAGGSRGEVETATRQILVVAEYSER